MNQLNKLKTKSLFKKYDYYLSKIEWIEQSIKENEEEFNEYTYSIINSNSELKELYDIKRSKIGDGISNRVDRNVDVDVMVDKDPNLKKLFRKIVKETHPDKVQDIDLNNIYLRVVESYDSDNLLNVYRICDELNIDYTLQVDDEYIESEVNKLKNRIVFLENSYVYRWINNTQKNKDKIILDYIDSLI